MLRDHPGPNADSSRPGTLIRALLETKAVGRRRLRGGTSPGGVLNVDVMYQVLRMEGFVVGTMSSCQS